MVHFSECSTVTANCNTEEQIEMRDGTVEHFPALLQLDPPPVVERRLHVGDRRRGQRRGGERHDAVEGGDFLAEDLGCYSVLS